MGERERDRRTSKIKLKPYTTNEKETFNEKTYKTKISAYYDTQQAHARPFKVVASKVKWD